MLTTSAVLAIIMAIGCAAVAILGSWQQGAGGEAFGLAIVLVGSAIIALVTHRLRYLAAGWGLFLGVWLIAVELLLVLPMRSKGVVMQDKTITLVIVVAVTAVALVGLTFALIAPSQDR